MPYIHALEIEDAPYRHSQSDILTFMVETFRPDRRERLMLENAFAGSGIEFRNSVLPDFMPHGSEPVLFNGKDEPGIEQRMQVFMREGQKMVLNAARKSMAASGLRPEQVTHLIVFSCTGLVNPGLENLVLEDLGLPPSTDTQGIYFAGCHGAFKAMKMAKMLAQAEEVAEPNILVCGLELCTLHFIPGRTGDQIRANTLFADGAAAFVVSREKPKSGYRLGRFAQEIIRTQSPLMSWNIGAQAFFMTLSSKIDTTLRSFNLPAFIERIVPSFKGAFICHPGGRSILEAVEEQVRERYQADLHSSYEVLRQHGNMSSISILYILQAELERATRQLMAIGFGPGLTVEGLHLELC